mmetsp:Transcript_2259/g.5359  ORF Transcript_2259/g.5359 Transcript_2259/m.5359 type:complete len:295 (+) Transcript_2259:232-1116(+)
MLRYMQRRDACDYRIRLSPPVEGCCAAATAAATPPKSPRRCRLPPPLRFGALIAGSCAAWNRSIAPTLRSTAANTASPAFSAFSALRPSPAATRGPGVVPGAGADTCVETAAQLRSKAHTARAAASAVSMQPGAGSSIRNPLAPRSTLHSAGSGVDAPAGVGVWSACGSALASPRASRARVGVGGGSRGGSRGSCTTFIRAGKRAATGPTISLAWPQVPSITTHAYAAPRSAAAAAGIAAAAAATCPAATATPPAMSSGVTPYPLPPVPDLPRSPSSPPPLASTATSTWVTSVA